MPLLPHRIRFPVPQARKKPDPAWTGLCKALVQLLLSADYHSKLLPDSVLPRRLKTRIFNSLGRSAYSCFGCHCMSLDPLCPDCEPLWCTTEAGLRRISTCYRSPSGAYWSSEEVYTMHLERERQEQEDAESFYDGDYDDDDDDSEVADYHSHPSRSSVLKFHQPDDKDPWKQDPIRIGFEWEYNARSSITRSAQAAAVDDLGFALAERDGSLDVDRGLEVVTGWSTLGTVSRWAKEIGACIQVNSLEDAGLHVNVSGLKPVEIAKYITFMNRNLSLTERIGGRRTCSYANAQGGDLKVYLSGPLQGRRPFTDKYSVCNVRDNGTIEVRVFNSAYEAKEIVYRIEYAWAVAHFCRQPGLDLRTLRFKAWLGENPWAVRGCRNLLQAFPDLCPVKFVKRKLMAA